MKIVDDFNDRGKIIDFLLKTDELFPDSLSSDVNITEYADKVLTNGKITVAIEENEIASLCMYYCNNKETCRAFITLIVTDLKYQHTGITQLLIDEVFKIVLQNGMKEIALEVHPDNLKAIKFYKKNQFEFESEGKKITLKKCLY